MELLHNEREAEHDQCESYASTLQTHIVSSTVLLGGVFVVMVEGEFPDNENISDTIEVMFAALCVSAFAAIFLSIIIAIRQTQKMNKFMSKKAEMHKARVSELLGKVMAAEEASHISNADRPLGSDFVHDICQGATHARYRASSAASRRWIRKGISVNRSIFSWWKEKENIRSIRLAYVFFWVGSLCLSGAVACFVDTRYRYGYKNDTAAWAFDGTCGAAILFVLFFSEEKIKQEKKRVATRCPIGNRLLRPQRDLLAQITGQPCGKFRRL